MQFFTIGVYNSTEVEFFNKLTQHKIDMFCDIRQRRGVRGSKYAFVNSNRLQQKLNELDIRYGYVPELAPTTEIRTLQKEVDEKKGELKSERKELGKIFVIEYKNKVLNCFDFENLFDNLDKIGASRVAFFCVEEHAKACHRSIVADKLREAYNYSVTDL